MQPKSIFLSSLGALRTVAILTVVNLLILSIRNYVVDDKALNFLLMNLFSGFVPLIIAYLLLLFNQKTPPIVFWLATLSWVLFYPNSPYMISDLIHENIDDPGAEGTLFIFNTLIIFSIAMLSVFYGFMSIKIMYSLFQYKYNARTANIFIIITLLLSSLGFYLGRIVKGFVWNSDTSIISHTTMDKGGTLKNLYTSDLFLHPIETFQKIWDSLFPISTHIEAYYMMALITVIQFSLLAMMRDVEDFQKSDILIKKASHPHETIL